MIKHYIFIPAIKYIVYLKNTHQRKLSSVCHSKTKNKKKKTQKTNEQKNHTIKILLLL